MAKRKTANGTNDEQRREMELERIQRNIRILAIASIALSLVAMLMTIIRIVFF